MKLGAFVYGDVRNTSGLHGYLQSGQAVDCYGGDKTRPLIFIAPADGTVGGVYKDTDPRYNGCHFYTGKIDLIIHHSNPIVIGNVKKGQEIARSAWHHFHIAVKSVAGWKPIWCYTDPNTVRYTSLDTPPVIYQYSKLPNYADYDVATGLPINNNTMNDIITFNSALTIQCTNTVDMNIRQEPNTKAESIGKVSPNTVFTCKQIVSGEGVGGQPVWFRYGLGWVSGEYCKDITVIQDCTPYELELKIAKEKISTLEKLNAELLDQTQKCKEIYDAIKTLKDYLIVI